MAGAIDPDSFSDSLVILGAAGLVIPGFARFRISPVIGFILVGLAVGPPGRRQVDREAPGQKKLQKTLFFIFFRDTRATVTQF